jgi:hypothetical protein
VGVSHPLIAALATLLAFVVGLTLPDVDMALWLGHRSAVTHSVLLPGVLLARRRWWPGACGFGGGLGLHLAAEFFPNRMIGFATVKLPLVGALSAAGSYWWLGVNALACLGLAAWVLRRLHAGGAAVLVAGAAGVAGVAYLWRTDGGWPVLAIVAVLVWGAWRWRRA